MVGIELGRVCFRRRATTLTLSVARWVHNSAMATWDQNRDRERHDPRVQARALSGNPRSSRDATVEVKPAVTLIVIQSTDAADREKLLTGDLLDHDVPGEDGFNSLLGIG